jgi:hypothetical protein
MKESGEKGGTEDINIGVGELQECTISKSMDTSTMDLAQFAINGNSLLLMFETVSSLGTVEFVSEFTTPQTAVFAGVSVVQDLDGRSFDLNFSLFYNADYNPEFPILREVMTGNFRVIPEPTSTFLLTCFWAVLCLPSRWVRVRSA